jgi:hypothetical protein
MDPSCVNLDLARASQPRLDGVLPQSELSLIFGESHGDRPTWSALQIATKREEPRIGLASGSLAAIIAIRSFLVGGYRNGHDGAK